MARRRQRGQRGKGSVLQVKTRRGTIRYQARYSWTEGGARKREAKTFDLRGDAEWWLDQAQRHGTPAEDLKVAEYMTAWLAGKRRVAPSTRTMYAEHVVHINEVLGGYRLTELRRRHIEAFVDDRSKHVSVRSRKRLSPATVGKLLGTLRSALEAGVPREIPDNPAARVEAPKVERDRVEAMTPDAAAAVIEAVRGTWLEQIVRVLLGSGMRLGEALALDQGDVHDGWVSLRKSKTTIRAVRLSSDADAAIHEAVKAAPRRGPREPVFFSVKRVRGTDHRDRMRGDSVTSNLPKHLERAGLPALTPHKLRHGVATLMVRAGVPMRTVAEQLGHANPSLTARTYAHVAPDSLAAAVQVLDEAVATR